MRNKLKIILPIIISTLIVAGIVWAANSFPTSLNNWQTGDTITADWANSLEAKIGVDNSNVTSSLDYLVKTHAQPAQLTVSGTTTLSSLANGFLKVDANGVVSTSTIDISDNTNLTASAPLSLVGDDLQIDTTGDWTGTLDGYEGADFLLKAGGTITGDLTVNGTSTLATTTITDLTIGSLSGVLKASTGVVSGGATTDDLPEGTTNLYFSGKTTDDLSEGTTNLYYTDARARSALSATAPITYNSATGEIGLTTPLSASYGGTGQDTSAWTGLLRITAGSWATTTIDVSDDTNLAAGRSLTLTGDTVDADAELYTDEKSIIIESPTVDDDALAQIEFPTAITITKVVCSVATSTASTTIQFDERAEATPNTAGTDVMTSPLVCDGDSESTTSFANAGIAANNILSLDIDAVSGTPGVLRIHIFYTKDD